MERIHCIIGVIVFIIFTCAAAGQEDLTQSQRIVALTILGEARGEGRSGMYAVACVLQKRQLEGKKHIIDVCLKEKQFSIWNGLTTNGRFPRDEKLYYLFKEKPEVVKYAVWLAKVCASGEQRLAQSFTGNANHYYSTDRKTPPYWTFKKVKKNNKIYKIPIKPTKKIGKHIFYKL